MGILTKTTAIGLVAPVVVAAAVAGWRAGWWVALRDAALVAAPAGLAAGAWAARNALLYGDPTGYAAFATVWRAHLREVAAGEVPGILATQFRSFWGVFGWMNLPAPGWVHVGAAVLCLAAAMGLVAAGRSRDRRGSIAPAALLVGMVAAQEVTMLAIASRCGDTCFQGRYLFPAIAPAALLIGVGLARLLEATRAVGAAPVVIATLALGAAAMPATAIVPAYPAPTEPKQAALQLRHRAGVAFGSTAELVGYDVMPRRDWRAIRVRLGWRARERAARDYSAFVHLIDPRGAMLAQDDHVPGHNRGYPPTRWSPGDLVLDEHTLELPAGLGTGAKGLRIGLYDWATGERVPAREHARVRDGAFVVERAIELKDRRIAVRRDFASPPISYPARAP